MNRKPVKVSIDAIRSIKEGETRTFYGLPSDEAYRVRNRCAQLSMQCRDSGYYYSVRKGETDATLSITFKLRNDT